MVEHTSRDVASAADPLGRDVCHILFPQIFVGCGHGLLTVRVGGQIWRQRRGLSIAGTSLAWLNSIIVLLPGSRDTDGVYFGFWTR
jgi:hypothetical protein